MKSLFTRIVGLAAVFAVSVSLMAPIGSHAAPVNSRASKAGQDATNALFEARLDNLETAAPTNQVAVSTTVFQASNAVHAAAIGGKQGTNATLTALSSANGASLTNLTLANIVGIDGKANTNQLGGITFRMVDGTNLLAIVGTTTNQVYLAPYSP